MDLVPVTEGATRILVPAPDPTAPFPPGAAPVFYNPRMAISRDATVLLLRSLAPGDRPADYLDAMGATGLRGIRIAGEAGIPVTINDRSRRALALARANAARLGLAVEIVHGDANALMSSRRFGAVDLDPFGSPAPFTDAACRSARPYLFVTATDTAPLCGAHLRAGMRRYWARPMNTEYHAEVGLRILLGFVVREVVKYDRGLVPLCCFARAHFVRLHLRLQDGASAADRTLARIGFVHQCRACPGRAEKTGLLPESVPCPSCGGATAAIGPLWLGEIGDPDVMRTMRAGLATATLAEGPALDRLLALLAAELPTATHYDYHVLAKRLGLSPPPIGAVLARLEKAGYRASRAHYAGTAVKTDAPLEEMYGTLTLP
ncbi:MAG: tRNA (guanine(10)-N(2))-dimethyltransferase [Methanospirillum sp.]|nr:tRNA (guanine(10)-N(2))-dimethyltransferase [Methanospirillum sp.]